MWDVERAVKRDAMGDAEAQGWDAMFQQSWCARFGGKVINQSLAGSRTPLLLLSIRLRHLNWPSPLLTSAIGCLCSRGIREQKHPGTTPRPYLQRINSD